MFQSMETILPKAAEFRESVITTQLLEVESMLKELNGFGDSSHEEEEESGDYEDDIHNVEDSDGEGVELRTSSVLEGHNGMGEDISTPASYYSCSGNIDCCCIFSGILKFLFKSLYLITVLYFILLNSWSYIELINNHEEVEILEQLRCYDLPKKPTNYNLEVQNLMNSRTIYTRSIHEKFMIEFLDHMQQKKHDVIKLSSPSPIIKKNEMCSAIGDFELPIPARLKKDSVLYEHSEAIQIYHAKPSFIERAMHGVKYLLSN